VLDIFEDILSKLGTDVNTWRPRIEHAQVFQPSDLERVGKLGGWSEHCLSLSVIGYYLITGKPWHIVIASVQPTQAYVHFSRGPCAMTSIPITEHPI